MKSETGQARGFGGAAPALLIRMEAEDSAEIENHRTNGGHSRVD